MAGERTLDREAIVKLVREALTWCDLAAGDGHCRQQPDGTYRGPEDFLYEFALTTGEEDWERIPDLVADEIAAAFAARPAPSSTETTR